MKVLFRVSYHKDIRRRRGTPIAWYDATRKGDTIFARIHLHPILKKYPDLKRGVLGHEKHEITAWANGSTAAHRYANNHEPKVTRELGGKQGFWQEIEQREQARS